MWLTVAVKRTGGRSEWAWGRRSHRRVYRLHAQVEVEDGRTLNLRPSKQPQYFLLLRFRLGRAGATSASVLDRKEHWR